MIVGLTGARGMLGQELVREATARSIELVPWDREQFDILDRQATSREISAVQPKVVIHAAAWTDVDGCEADPQKAYEVNGCGTENVARACEACGAALVYVSTDYVFSGEKQGPYLEDDATDPINEYGKSKRIGEDAVEKLGAKGIVVRTSWVYADHGKNFVMTMLRLGREGKPLRVVDDQIGVPTFAADLARALLDLASAAARGKAQGIYHVTNAGAISWYGFARTIFQFAGIRAEVSPCTSAEFPRPARRPKNSVLADQRLAAAGVAALPPWEEALARCILRITTGPTPQSPRAIS